MSRPILIAGVVTALLGPTAVQAQIGGVLRKLPGGVGDAARAAEALKEAGAARKISSPLAGTYRLVFSFGAIEQPSDSVEVFVRTFEKPITGNVGGNFPTRENASAGQMIQGYSLTVVASRAETELPATVEDMRGRNSSLGGGLALVYPFAGDSTETQAFSIDWVVLLPKKTSAENDTFNRRMERVRSGGIVRADGTGESRSVNRLALADATTRLQPDGTVRVRYALKRGNDVVVVRGERISTDRYASP